ncbi:thioredoxin family protein [Streptomyces sp. NPDC094448]|uniref:thioredoxin family protein n=1 Tax=Streptomyces sp. NPDC094448 TaxID=3366063 RepID=UPI0038128AAF
MRKPGPARRSAVLAGALMLAFSGLLAPAASAAATAPASAPPAPSRAALAGTVVTVTDATFDRDVVRSRVPVLVRFCAEWSGPCRQADSTLTELARDYGTRLTVAKVDIDQNPESTRKYNVTAIPTYHLFKGGVVVGTKVGPWSKQGLVDFLAEHGV